MRFVTIKTEAQQARAMLFRTRDLLVRQRTQTINALRGNLAEHGVVAPQGAVQVKRLAEAINEDTSQLPTDMVAGCQFQVNFGPSASNVTGFGTAIQIS